MKRFSPFKQLDPLPWRCKLPCGRRTAPTHCVVQCCTEWFENDRYVAESHCRVLEEMNRGLVDWLLIGMPSGSVRIWEGMTEPFLKVEILYQFQLLLQICTNTFLWLHWVLTFARWSTRLGILRYSLAGLRRCPSDAVATDLGAFRGGVRSAGISGKKSLRQERIARLFGQENWWPSDLWALWISWLSKLFIDAGMVVSQN